MLRPSSFAINSQSKFFQITHPITYISVVGPSELSWSKLVTSGGGEAVPTFQVTKCSLKTNRNHTKSMLKLKCGQATNSKNVLISPQNSYHFPSTRNLFGSPRKQPSGGSKTWILATYPSAFSPRWGKLHPECETLLRGSHHRSWCPPRRPWAVPPCAGAAGGRWSRCCRCWRSGCAGCPGSPNPKERAPRNAEMHPRRSAMPSAPN